MFKDITKSYLYLLKKYKENIPDKQIYELKENFNDFVNNETNNNNILLKNEKFDLNNFNKIFNENNINDNNDGYNDFMKNGIETEKEKEKESYIFSHDFNITIFNKLFNQNLENKIEKQEIKLYKEPETLFQSNTGFTNLGEDKIYDYSSLSGFNKTLKYTDCKIAYSEPEKLENLNMETFNTLEDLEKNRENINYTMDEKNKKEYNEYIKHNQKQEELRLERQEKNDLNILKKYNEINKILLK